MFRSDTKRGVEQYAQRRDERWSVVAEAVAEGASLAALTPVFDAARADAVLMGFGAGPDTMPAGEAFLRDYAASLIEARNG